MDTEMRIAADAAGGEDHAAQRRLMVLGQITPNGVNDPLLVAALREVPRETLVPPAYRPRAYADQPVPLGSGRVLLQPMVIARLIQLLLPQPGERALVLGAGPGYGALVLARMGLAVTAIESDPALCAVAARAFAAAPEGAQPVLRPGDPAAGEPTGAPWRVILVEGAAARLPESLTAQLGEGGRLAMIRATDSPVGRAVLLRKAGGALGEQWVFEAQAPVLPGFAAEAGFRF
ncbi:MAG: protein-L-isoaspartate O-methyltransferase [Rubritepida sp.]|jgi:protein-L-isoaspartate(D-aspartate) O-methyltransferase|nr:protein-L-isoaspartate O-methyltransferase [Rubritepida sp.]MCU0944969.1 protein-L-isoaspartate O-methyltransferase [Rubritepida sp.]